jgi:D-alanyl-D-alanine carboxypeptidase
VTNTGRLLLTALITAALVAAVLAATCTVCCGDDDDPTATPGITTAPTASLPASPTNSRAPGETAAPTDVPGGSGDPSDPPSETVPPSSVGLLTLVDKQHSLPVTYAPPDLVGLTDGYLAPGFGGSLRQDAASALVEMLDAAYTEGYDIRARSAYRSYAEQQTTFDYWVSVLGYDEATRISAMPGHSEHQLGTAADLTTADVGWELVESFSATAAGQWLADNAADYGFALSYPEGGEPTTGYAYEPWHFRYIGHSEAAAFAASGLYLNQYLAQ